MADTLAELREAVELAQKALDNELFNNDKPMTAPPFAGMLANVADQQAQLIDAQQQRIEALEKGLEPFADEWAAYLEFRRDHTLSFGEWQRDYSTVDETHTIEAFAVLRSEKGGEG